MTEQEVQALVDKRVDERIAEVESRYARQTLGAAPNQVRLDCMCGQCVGIIDPATGEVTAGYGAQASYFHPSKPFALKCRRCHSLPVFNLDGTQHGERGKPAN